MQLTHTSPRRDNFSYIPLGAVCKRTERSIFDFFFQMTGRTPRFLERTLVVHSICLVEPMMTHTACIKLRRIDRQIRNGMYTQVVILCVILDRVGEREITEGWGGQRLDRADEANGGGARLGEGDGGPARQGQPGAEQGKLEAEDPVQEPRRRPEVSNQAARGHQGLSVLRCSRLLRSSSRPKAPPASVYVLI